MQFVLLLHKSGGGGRGGEEIFQIGWGGGVGDCCLERGDVRNGGNSRNERG